GRHPRTPAAIDALDAGDRVAVAVGGTEIGRVAGGVGDRAGWRGLRSVDAAGEAGGVLGGQQLVERRLDGARVGAPALTVGEGELLDLDHEVHQIGRAEPHRGDVEMLEDFELLEYDEAGR